MLTFPFHLLFDWLLSPLQRPCEDWMLGHLFLPSWQNGRTEGEVINSLTTFPDIR